MRPTSNIDVLIMPYLPMFRMEQQDGKSRHNKSANMARVVFWGDNMSARDATGQTNPGSVITNKVSLRTAIVYVMVSRGTFLVKPPKDLA